MIRWCSYCQRYQGEVEPFDDYRLTHGLCSACHEAAVFDDRVLVARAHALREFYDGLRDAARRGAVGEATRLLDQGIALGLVPTDLMLGMLQPVLHEVGDLWARGELRAHEEHRTSHVIGALFELFHARFPAHEKLRFGPHPDVLLTVAPTNLHTIGTQLVEHFLLAHGVSTYLVIPSIPVDELELLTRELRPRVVGVSIALEAQLVEVHAIARMLERLPEESRPRLAVGGMPIRGGVALPEGLRAEAFGHPDELLLALRLSPRPDRGTSP